MQAALWTPLRDRLDQLTEDGGKLIIAHWWPVLQGFYASQLSC